MGDPEIAVASSTRRMGVNNGPGNGMALIRCLLRQFEPYNHQSKRSPAIVSVISRALAARSCSNAPLE
jgi:hypothetical protein